VRSATGAAIGGAGALAASMSAGCSANSCRASRQSMIVFITLMLAVACAKPKMCCNGKPCGDGCIELTKRCTKTVGTAICKLDGNCACETVADKAWQHWSSSGTFSGRHDFKAALAPLVGSGDDPWTLKLYSCFRSGGSLRRCVEQSVWGSAKTEL